MSTNAFDNATIFPGRSSVVESRDDDEDRDLVIADQPPLSRLDIADRLRTSAQLMSTNWLHSCQDRVGKVKSEKLPMGGIKASRLSKKGKQL